MAGKGEKLEMKLILSLKEKDEDGWDEIFSVENPPYIPVPGETFSENSMASGNFKGKSKTTSYQVIGRHTHILRVGGSQPTGSEDMCVVSLKLERVDAPISWESVTDMIQ